MNHRIIVLLFAAALTSACAPDSDEDAVELDTAAPADVRVIEISPQRDAAEDTSSVPTTPVVASEGGRVTSQNGQLALDFPPDSLGADADLALPFLPEDERPEAAADAIGGVYALEPAGLSILLPVTATATLPDPAALRDEAGLHRLPLLADLSAARGFAVRRLDSSAERLRLVATLDADSLGVLTLLPDAALAADTPTGFGVAPALEAARTEGATEWPIAPRLDNASPMAVTLDAMSLSASGALVLDEGDAGSDPDGRPSTTVQRRGDAILDSSPTLAPGSSASAAPITARCSSSGAARVELILSLADGVEMRFERHLSCP